MKKRLENTIRIHRYLFTAKVRCLRRILASLRRIPSKSVYIDASHYRPREAHTCSKSTHATPRTAIRIKQGG
jgi:hypothetical protein